MIGLIRWRNRHSLTFCNKLESLQLQRHAWHKWTSALEAREDNQMASETAVARKHYRWNLWSFAWMITFVFAHQTHIFRSSIDLHTIFCKCVYSQNNPFGKHTSSDWHHTLYFKMRFFPHQLALLLCSQCMFFFFFITIFNCVSLC